MVDFSLIIGGEAGFGIMTTGAVFSRICARLGYHVFDFVQYPSLIRGGHNAYLAHIGEEEVTDILSTVDFLVCLNTDTFNQHKEKLRSSSFIIFDEDELPVDGNYQKVVVPFKKILQQLKGETVMKNTIALGAILALLGTDLTLLNQILEKQFTKKGQPVVEFNKKFAQLGWQHVKNRYPNLIKPILQDKTKEQQLVLSGNEAFSLGAVIADCRLYCAYPMTPASSVLTTLAAWQEKCGMIIRHAEDEISVINTAIGASFAGVRAAVGTSGGGFALMVESISLAGIAELPVVIFLAQRPGPATGMPTWTEQGDLLFAVHAGHGEFPKIVLAPADVEEMIKITGEAFNLADIYQTPVIIISDMLLSESHKTISQKFIDQFITAYKVERGKTIEENSNSKYLRYQITDDGISPRLIPGMKGYYYQANSYEHLEDGHTTEEANARIQQVEKRNKKWQTYFKNHFKKPIVFGNQEAAKTIFVSWGSNKGAILRAQKLLKTKNYETAYIHFTHVYPLAQKAVVDLFSDNKRYILIEGNSQAQFGKLLRMETGIEIKEKILRYDGRPVTAEEIVARLSLLQLL
jgi:2-oxoglutarate ferredoxin oxidoreductase subunit alpha